MSLVQGKEPMNVSMIVTLKKRPDLTTEQFRYHYETIH